MDYKDSKFINYGRDHNLMDYWEMTVTQKVVPSCGEPGGCALRDGICGDSFPSSCPSAMMSMPCSQPTEDTTSELVTQNEALLSVV